MKCVLMNKETPVLVLDIDQHTGIQKILDLCNLDYMPIGIHKDQDDTSKPCRIELNKWWSCRSIPASRDCINEVLKQLNVSSTFELANKSFGLSLTDQYWMKPYDSNLEWKDINFFSNSFSKDVGNALFQDKINNHDINLMSPDNTSDGWLKKKWVIKDNDRYLIKAGSKPYQQEPFNEVIASRLLEKISHVPYVKYDLVKEGELSCSVCKNFITTDTEFVPAYYVFNSLKLDGNDTSYNHLLKCAKHHNIPNIKEYLDTMLTADYIIINTDRHWGNWGFIRNVNTLKFEGPAPLFDNGTSLWNKEVRVIKHQEPSKPFKNSHSKQIKLVSNLEKFNLKNLKELPSEFNELLKLNPNIDNSRRYMLCDGLKARIHQLQNCLNQQYNR